MTYVKTIGRTKSVAKVTDKLKKVDKERRKAFGQRMKRVREDLQMTQLDMANSTDQVYFTFISQVETGSAKIPTKDLPKWAKALQLDTYEFAKSYLKAVDQHLFEAMFERGNRDTIL